MEHHVKSKLQQFIPKIIHYCWFGDTPKSQFIQLCIKSWEKHLIGYQLREWTNADLPGIDNQYLQEAIAHKKWAFVSDYMRLYALEKEGGIYFDTDVEAKKNFDEFLPLDFFIGCEQEGKSKTLAMAVIGAKPHQGLIQKMLHLYDDISFIKTDGDYDMTTNPVRFSIFFTDTLHIPSIFCETDPIKIDENSFILPHDFFSSPSPNSYAVHHFTGTWLEPYARRLVCQFGCIRIVRYKKRKNSNENDIPQVHNEEKLLFNIPFWGNRHYSVMLLNMKSISKYEKEKH